MGRRRRDDDRLRRPRRRLRGTGLDVHPKVRRAHKRHVAGHDHRVLLGALRIGERRKELRRRRALRALCARERRGRRPRRAAAAPADGRFDRRRCGRGGRRGLALLVRALLLRLCHLQALLLLRKGKLRGALLLKELANRRLVALRLEHAERLRRRRRDCLRLRVAGDRGRGALRRRRRVRLALRGLAALGALAHRLSEVRTVLLAAAALRLDRGALRRVAAGRRKPAAPVEAVPRGTPLGRHDQPCRVEHVRDQRPVLVVLLRKRGHKRVVLAAPRQLRGSRLRTRGRRRRPARRRLARRLAGAARKQKRAGLHGPRRRAHRHAVRHALHAIRKLARKRPLVCAEPLALRALRRRVERAHKHGLGVKQARHVHEARRRAEAIVAAPVTLVGDRGRIGRQLGEQLGKRELVRVERREPAFHLE